jgi:glycosyltransferase involved in cell wall biosynthesis
LFIFIGIFKIFKKINFIVILSGLFAMKDTFFIIKVFRKVFLTIFLKVVNKLIFTSRSEYNFAVNKYPKYKEKFECIPFCLDTDFWKPQNNNIDINKKKGVLFIGNNGHRDFNLVIKIAEELNEIPFTFITNQISDSEIKSDNITNILGDWNAAHLSDVEIKQYYESSKLVILPINNTLVSSGQSAGLQAAAVGTAVVTTRTIGFWDYESYKDGENILFVENNELKNWTSIVKEAYENDSLLLNIGKNSKKLVNNTYHLDIFNTKLESFLAFENV